MKIVKRIIVALFVLLYITGTYGANRVRFSSINAERYLPEGSWSTCAPEEQGMNSEDLAKAFDFIQENEVHIQSLMIVRNGHVVLDAYFYPYREGLVHDMASITKSIISTLVGIAIDKDYIKSVKQHVLDFFPEYDVKNSDSRKKNLTIEHLLTMTSGFDCDAPGGEPRLSEMRDSDDWVKFVLELPMTAEPRTRFAYCSNNLHLLSAIITQTTGMNAMEFAREHLFRPLGIEDVIWPTDPDGNNYGWGDLFLLPKDAARIGCLFLQRGTWKDQQIISPEWIEQASKEHATDDGTGYGYNWWILNDYPGLYAAIGRGGQRIYIWPEKNLVAVLTGNGFTPSDVWNFIESSIRSDKPLKKNPEAHRHLLTRIEDAAKPPKPRAIPSLPLIAEKISDKTFVFEPNSWGIRSFSLTFKGGSEALFVFIGDNEEEQSPVGLDGLYRINSTSGRFGLPEALKGSWINERDFEILYNEFVNIHFYRILFSFKDETAVMKIVEERTGATEIMLTAKVKK